MQLENNIKRKPLLYQSELQWDGEYNYCTYFCDGDIYGVIMGKDGYAGHVTVERYIDDAEPWDDDFMVATYDVLLDEARYKLDKEIGE